MFIVAGLTALWVVECSGPNASVSGVELQRPEAAGQPYTVIATIDNGGRGDGSVRVHFTLEGEGRRFAADQQVYLRKDAKIQVSQDISAPPGDYTADAQVDYPPR